MTEGFESPIARQIAELNDRKRALKKMKVKRPVETRIFTVSNQKGGVGKTTTAVNVAAALAKAKMKVLIIDIDPQGNASTAVNVNKDADTEGTYEVLLGHASLAEVVQKSPELPGLECCAATINLAGAEIELVDLPNRETLLRGALDQYLTRREQLGDRLDYVFIDCPPSLGLLTMNAFAAAKEVMIPIQGEYYALEGLSQLLNSINKLQEYLNPQLHVSAILLTMFDKRTNLSREVAEEVRKHFPKQTLKTVIPRSVRISEAPSYGQTTITYDPEGLGATAYCEVANEIAKQGVQR